MFVSPAMSGVTHSAGHVGQVARLRVLRSRCEPASLDRWRTGLAGADVPRLASFAAPNLAYGSR